MNDPELKLAIAVCRAAYDDRAGAAVAQAAREVRWDRFLIVAARHRIQALCWHGLEPIAEVMPAAAAEQLQFEARAIVEANLRIAVECARLLAQFQSAKLPILFLKGLTLGALAYRDAFLKMGWDIDLLVERDRLADAAHLLRAAGYIPVIPASADGDQLSHWHAARKESVWHRADGGFHIDLHTRLADHPALLPQVATDSPSRMVTVTRGIELPTLGKDELFAYLAVHGASSAWFRLKWIADFAALLHGESSDEIERFFDRSQQLGAGRAAAQALLLAERLFEVELGETLRARLHADPANLQLTSLAERQLGSLGEPTERLMGTATIHLSQLLLLPGWRFKYSEATRQFRDMTGIGT